MPGRFFLTTPLAEVAAAFGADPGALADPGERLDAAPGETVAAVIGGPRRLAEMRWGMIPMGRRNARGRPVMETIVNARAETVFRKSAFENVRRCILPVSGWYEWTGERRRKTRWAIGGEAPLLAFAAIWDVWRVPGDDREIASLATVTVEPNADVRDIHHRMPGILPPEAWDAWLGEAWLEEAAGDCAALLRPAPDGSLRVRKAEGPD